jgi:hypothetical protein
MLIKNIIMNDFKIDNNKLRIVSNHFLKIYQNNKLIKLIEFDSIEFDEYTYQNNHVFICNNNSNKIRSINIHNKIEKI